MSFNMELHVSRHKVIITNDCIHWAFTKCQVPVLITFQANNLLNTSSRKWAASSSSPFYR